MHQKKISYICIAALSSRELLGVAYRTQINVFFLAVVACSSLVPKVTIPKGYCSKHLITLGRLKHWTNG